MRRAGGDKEVDGRATIGRFGAILLGKSWRFRNVGLLFGPQRKSNMINARTIWYTPLFSDGVRKQGRLLWGWGLGLMYM